METAAPLLGEPVPVELMNTIWADRDGLYDAIQDAEALNSWLSAVGDRLDLGQGQKVETAEAMVHRFRQLRDALRRLAAEVTSDDRPATATAAADLDRAVAILNRASALAPRWSELHWSADGPSRGTHTHRSPAEAVLSEIADQAIELFAGPQRLTLRACAGPGCVLYFVRRHPRREWCSDACGNRARVARHYQRHRPGQ